MIKYVLLAVLVVLLGGGMGFGGYILYSQTQAVLQERQDKRDALAKEKQAKEDALAAAAKRKKEAREQRLADKKYGKEHPDEVIRGLIADMETVSGGDGVTIYRYDNAGGEGVFLGAELEVPDNGSPTLYGVLSYYGDYEAPANSIHLVTNTGEYDLAFPLNSLQEGSEGSVVFRSPADRNMEETLRAIGFSINVKQIIGDGSLDDRNLAATEIARIQDMLELYDILRGAKSTGE